MNAVVAVNVEPAAALLASLRKLGLRLWVNDEGVIKASPGDRLTLEMRSQIQGLRDGLMYHLEIERRQGEQLRGRIEAMGRRWGYSLEEIDESQTEALHDLAGWSALCDADERSAKRARQAGFSYP
jgi:hypothetical protein